MGANACIGIDAGSSGVSGRNQHGRGGNKADSRPKRRKTKKKHHFSRCSKMPTTRLPLEPLDTQRCVTAHFPDIQSDIAYMLCRLMINIC